jgi:hypothetical protein
MIAEYLINLLKSKRDQKRHEVLKLRWEKAKLEKQLEQLKRHKAEETTEK